MAAPADTGFASAYEAAFSTVLTDYPRQGVTGLQREIATCYAKADTRVAVRDCYLLDHTLVTVEAHVRSMQERQIVRPDVSTVTAHADAALLRTGVETPVRAETLAAWARDAERPASREQVDELFAMLHGM